jgi:hypothetical protein
LPFSQILRQPSIADDATTPRQRQPYYQLRLYTQYLAIEPAPTPLLIRFATPEGDADAFIS